VGDRGWRPQAQAQTQDTWSQDGDCCVDELHLHAPVGSTRPARCSGRALRGGRVQSALYCPTAALPHVQVENQEEALKSEERRDGSRQEMNLERSCAPGTVLGTKHVLSH
jgi:hypothetical protein